MKIITPLVLSLMTSAVFAQTMPSRVEIKIEGVQAKKIYTTMTAVQLDGAAGHSFKNGKSIVCAYVNADMDDINGKPVSANDAKRYSCKFHIDSNGLITS